MAGEEAAESLVMRVNAPGQALAAERMVVAEPPAGWVRMEVRASGVCHADIGTAAARGRDVTFPVTPGHEIAGTIAALGEETSGWRLGDRAAVGWFGGSCGTCAFCRRGDVVHCASHMIPGQSYPGGWAGTVMVPADALARIPEGMDFFAAAPMGCAGVTAFNAIRRGGVTAGGTVAVFGIGGLGHLAVQFAARMGYRVVAIARGPHREEFARQLGAHHYIDSVSSDPGEALAELGGADLILATASSTDAVAGLLPGLSINGRLTLIGADGGELAIPVAQLVMKGHVVSGHLTGSAGDTEEAMRFALLNDVRPVTEKMPMEAANEALARIRAGEARFRIVLDPGSRS